MKKALYFIFLLHLVTQVGAQHLPKKGFTK